jgi:hypothetical protein
VRCLRRGTMTDVDNRERMDAGLIYDPTDPSLSADQNDALELLYD